jgi:hypothetical protein
VITALVETLGFRKIAPVKEQYAVSRDGMKLFGTMELEMAVRARPSSLLRACERFPGPRAYEQVNIARPGEFEVKK